MKHAVHKPEPWIQPVDGTQHWLLVSELEALALAEGIVLFRTQQQAREQTRYLAATAPVETPARETA